MRFLVDFCFSLCLCALAPGLALPYLALFKTANGLDQGKPVVGFVLGSVGSDPYPEKGSAVYVPVFNDGGYAFGGQSFLDAFSFYDGGKSACLNPEVIVDPGLGSGFWSGCCWLGSGSGRSRSRR